MRLPRRGNSPHEFRDAVRASRIGGLVVLAGIPDGEAYVLSASDALRRGLKIKFVRRMGDDYPRYRVGRLGPGKGQKPWLPIVRAWTWRPRF
jgi:hypothetical protein